MYFLVHLCEFYMKQCENLRWIQYKKHQLLLSYSQVLLLWQNKLDWCDKLLLSPRFLRLYLFVLFLITSSLIICYNFPSGIQNHLSVSLRLWCFFLFLDTDFMHLPSAKSFLPRSWKWWLICWIFFSHSYKKKFHQGKWIWKHIFMLSFPHCSGYF